MTVAVSSRHFSRLAYYRRVFSNYVARRPSHLAFWHERPEENPEAPTDRLGQYYMTFSHKADYPGPFDSQGVPLLDYGGTVGIQYNPIAIAQYGLARYNRYAGTGAAEDRSAFLCQADWLVEHLEPNGHGIPVWTHHFDWEYRDGIRAPWDSGLSQGCALSCLARAAESGDPRYGDALRRGFAAFLKDVRDGGVCLYEPNGDVWVEEVIVAPPSHILNGFLWGLWGIRDYHLATGDPAAQDLLDRCLATLRSHLNDYDTGWWSLYELSPFRLKMLASPFYHRLHIVQLRVMHRLTGTPLFAQVAERWEGYRGRRWNRWRSLAEKVLFKLLHY